VEAFIKSRNQICRVIGCIALLGDSLLADKSAKYFFEKGRECFSIPAEKEDYLYGLNLHCRCFNAFNWPSEAFVRVVEKIGTCGNPSLSYSPISNKYPAYQYCF